jgi:flagellar protein FliS
MNLAANLASRYKAVQVTTSSPGQILLMLYDGLLRFVGEGKQALERGDRVSLGERVGRAQAILEHLTLSLDRRVEPELCARLEAVYGYCIMRLSHANLKRDAAAFEEVERLLTPLRDAWRVAVAEAAKT